MKGLELNENNDVLIKNNQIQMVENAELTRQTVKCVLGTNKGEWCLNTSEGVDFGVFLGKIPNDETVLQNEITQGLEQVDESLAITEFEVNRDNSKRKLSLRFKAESESGETINIENSYD